MKSIVFIAVFMIVGFSIILVQSADAEKTLTVTQKCENTTLHLFVINQDNNPVNKAKILDGTRMEVLATADESEFVVLPADLQGERLRVGGGSYTPTSFTSDDCQPVEIEFEKNDQDIMIVHHHSFSNFDPTEDYSDAPHLTPFTGMLIGGDIVNLSEYNLTDIRINIQPYGEKLGSGESKSWYPIKKILRPGEVSPFFIHMGGGFDNYSIKIDDYKGTSEMPVQPQVKISDIAVSEDNNGTEILTISCTDTLEKSNDFRLLLLSYSENKFLEAASLTDEYMMSISDPNATDCITDGKITIPEPTNHKYSPEQEFVEYVKNDRFEVFIIQGDYNLFYDVQEMNKSENLNAYENQSVSYTQTAVHSNYFPDSLTPRYVNIDSLKLELETRQEIKKVESDITNLQNNSQSDSSKVIPNWIKNNADWWSQDQIDDKTFVSGIQFLIKEEIIAISSSSSSNEDSTTNEIPQWIKTNTGWWSQGLITDDDFLKGIEFLVEKGIIVV